MMLHRAIFNAILFKIKKIDTCNITLIHSISLSFVIRHKSKVAGAQNEREMVKKLENNHTLRKFGHAFQTPGMGNMASRLILRNNDEGEAAINVHLESPHLYTPH